MIFNDERKRACCYLYRKATKKSKRLNIYRKIRILRKKQDNLRYVFIQKRASHFMLHVYIYKNKILKKKQDNFDYTFFLQKA